MSQSAPSDASSRRVSPPHARAWEEVAEELDVDTDVGLSEGEVSLHVTGVNQTQCSPVGR